MGRTVFVREIVTVLEEPRACPTCKRSDRLEKDVIAERRSGGRTFLCGRCEVLVVITGLNLKVVELSSPGNDTIMLKEPYQIRRVTYQA